MADIQSNADADESSPILPAEQPKPVSWLYFGPYCLKRFHKAAQSGERDFLFLGPRFRKFMFYLACFMLATRISDAFYGQRPFKVVPLDELETIISELHAQMADTSLSRIPIDPETCIGNPEVEGGKASKCYETLPSKRWRMRLLGNFQRMAEATAVLLNTTTAEWEDLHVYIQKLQAEYTELAIPENSWELYSEWLITITSTLYITNKFYEYLYKRIDWEK